LAVFLSIGLRDVIPKTKDKKNLSLIMTFSLSFEAIRNEKSIIIGALGFGAFTMSTIAILLYGIDVYKLEY